MFIMSLQCVYATKSIIQILGDDKANKGDDKQLTVKLLSSDTIGIISGKIMENENVQIIKVNWKNNWNLTYNSKTGEFNIYKAEGAKEEEIITIEYKAINENATGKITISNLKATSIEYISETLSNAEKNVQINEQETMNEETESQDDINTKEEENNKEEQKEKTEETESKEDINIKEERKDNYIDVEEEHSIEDNSKKESDTIKTLPKTGNFNMIIPIIIVVVILGTIFFYLKCNSYKDT